MTTTRKSSLYRTITPGKTSNVSSFSINQQVALNEIVRDARETCLKQSVGCQAANKTGLAVLFVGSHGTGKILAAQCLAKELFAKLVMTTFTKLKSRFIGETEKNLARVFDAASQRGAVLFFDEADALFGKRTTVKDSHDRYANQEVSYLLQRLDSYPGLVILAANSKSALSRTVQNRLKHVVGFPETSLKTKTGPTRPAKASRIFRTQPG